MITKKISRIFRDIANILEIKGESIFRARAYERAARNIEALREDIQDLINEGRIEEIPGVGGDLAEKIKEIVKEGGLKFYEDLKKTIPEGLIELLSIPSVGPKSARLFFDRLKIKNIIELEAAAKDGRLLSLEGIKKKTVDNILKGISLFKKGQERMDLHSAISLSENLLSGLRRIPAVGKVSVCGSLRRMKDTIRDIDILAVSDSPEEVMDGFVKLPEVKGIIAKGDTKSTIITRENHQVDLRVVEGKSYGAALIYFTGSKNFNIKIRQLAIKKGLKINEYGVFKLKGKKGQQLRAGTEEEVFRTIGLSFIEPQLREDEGEIELAAKNNLPDLVCLKDIKGDLHCHSNYSDGNNSIAEMARAAGDLGYEYINITDHSQGLKVARGLSLKELERKRKEIERENSGRRKIRILFGAEVDIDSEGGLDYPDDVLSAFDVVVAAIHSGFKQSKRQITRRLVEACKNRFVDIIAHPTGRLWGTRDGYEIDFDEFFKAAKDNSTALEINAYPLRLDLNDRGCRKAKEMGIKLAVSTDSHSADQLKFMGLGVACARRGWLTKDDLINTLSYPRLQELFKK